MMTDEDLEAVRFKAYQIWDREGRPHGRDENHWRMALEELGLDQNQDRAAIAAHARQWDDAEGNT